MLGVRSRVARMLALLVVVASGIASGTAPSPGEAEAKAKAEVQRLEPQATTDPAGLADALGKLIEILHEQSRPADVLPLAIRMQALLSPLTEPPLELLSEAHNIHTQVLMETGDLAASMQQALRSLKWHERNASGTLMMATALNLMAWAFSDNDQSHLAVAPATESLRLSEALMSANDVRLAQPLNTLGSMMRYTGELASAQRLQSRALALAEASSQTSSLTLAFMLSDLATTVDAMGEYEVALELNRRGLDLRQKHLGADHFLTSVSLAHTGELLRKLGRYAEALQYTAASNRLDVQRFGVDHLNVGIGLNNQGLILTSLGQPAEAIQMFRRALLILEKQTTAGPRTATTLDSLASAQRRLGDLEGALASERRSLALRERAFPSGHLDVAISLRKLATAALESGAMAEAGKLAKRSLEMSESLGGAEHPDVGLSLVVHGRMLAAEGDRAGALAALQRAERLLGMARRAEGHWSAQQQLQRLHVSVGHRDLAIFWGKQAVNTLQAMRSEIKALPPGLQQGFLSDKRPVYTELADLLIDAGRLAEAQQVLALLKEEELHEFLLRSAEGESTSGGVTFVGAERTANERWRSLSLQLGALGREKAELQRKARVGLDAAQRARLAEVEATFVEANRHYDQFVATLSAEFAADSVRQREFGARQFDNLVTLQDVLRDLGNDTVLLHYVVSDKRVAIIVTTADVQVAREVAVDAAALNRLVLQLRQALQGRTDPVVHARELYRLLVEPVAVDLRQAGAKRLALSLDGTLRYVPFAALHDGHQYLVERYALSVYTEAARTSLTRKPRQNWAMTGLGVTREVAGFAALPAVRNELEGILGRVLPGEIFLDEQFTAERLSLSLHQPAPVLHIASHFSFQPGTEADSFLVLGDGTRLTLQQMRERRLRFGGVELLTLSACDTAMGGGRNESGAEGRGLRSARAASRCARRTGDALARGRREQRALHGKAISAAPEWPAESRGSNACSA